MGKINYQKIYTTNKDEWKALTREPQKYEALLAGHYSESNHFVYELLQNAEDEKADRVVIEYYDDKLVFYHNGIPFDENDVRGVSSMLMGTKDRNSAQTIGRFGMGFKSVFKYTYQPEIYSDEEAFRIENYLLPVEIQNGWDYRRVMKELEYGLSSGGKYYPFSEQKHLTKIVIPFAKRKNDGTVIPVSGKEVLQKLQELNGEILLFLNHIKKLFWINQTNGKYAMITLDVDSTDCNLNSCRIEGSAYQQKEEITRYLKFKKTFDHPEMKDAEVSVAYKVNNKANVVYELKGEPVWVYFPTRDMTKLPFLIHGSFETAVSREKLMTPSEFNSALFQLLGDLIADSMKELKKRKLITQNFIRKVLIVAFKDETDNNTIPGLRNKITECLKKGSLIPDKDGNYYSVDELVIPVPFGIADFFDSKLFQTTFEDVGHFVAYNNEREANFNEYLAWMVDEVGVQTFTLVDWAKRMGNLKGICVPTKSAEYEKLEDFYDFLSDNRESIYTTGLRYSRSGRYEQTIRNNVSTAWKILKTSPIILNAQEELTAPYQGETEKLYLSATSDYQQMVLSSIVHKNVSAKFGQLLKDGFTLTDFDNFQYVKEKILKKYIKGETINFDNSENYEDEYIEDLNQILLLFAKNHNVDEIQNLIAKASIIKIVTDDNTVTFAKPALTYAANSVEGVDLRIYYETPVVEEDDEEDDDESYYREFDDSGKYLIDEAFYHNHGISVKKLQQFGIITTPITEGRRYFSGGSGKESWNALGDFCPEMTMDYLDDNLYIIEYIPKSELARKKSSEIFKLVLSVRQKLAGRLSKRKTNPYEVEEESRILRRLKSYHSWLYDKSGNLREPREISKYDLDTSLYGEVISDKNFYSMLGFIETEDDNTAEAFEHVDKIRDAVLHKYKATPDNLLEKIAQVYEQAKRQYRTSIERDDWEEIFRGLENWVQDIPDYQQEKDIYLKDFINGCNVVGVSCTENAKTLTENGFDDFDVVIIDEVSKATPPELLIPMLRGRKIVLVGDHRQLPPLFNEHEKTYLEVAEQQEDMEDVIVPLTMEDFNKYKDMVTASLFERYFENANDSIKETLNYQYRMHTDIMDIINIFYDEYLRDGNEDNYTYDTKAHYLSIPSTSGTEMIIPERHAYWFDSSELAGEKIYEQRRQGSSSAENLVEAEMIMAMLKKMELQYANMKGRETPVSIGVISFYYDQVALIRQMLRQESFYAIDVEVNTVDRFQGKEKEIVFVSLVRNVKNFRHSVDSHIAAFQRINVAFSRAQNLLIIVGAKDMYVDQPVKLTDMNDGTEKTIMAYKQIVEMMDQRGTYFTGDEVITDVRAEEILQELKQRQGGNEV